MRNHENPDICVRPWTSAIASERGATVCCYIGHSSVKYEEWQGPYAGDWSWWNGPELSGLRKRMLTEGCAAVCPHAGCPQRHRPKSPVLQTADMPVYMADSVLEDIDAGRVQVTEPAVDAQVVVTRACDAACPFCVRGDDPVSVNPPDASRAYENIGTWAARCHSMRLSGGEVMTLSDAELKALFKPLKKASPQHMPLMTNGRNLTLKRYKAYVHDGPITTVGLSLDTIDSAAYQFNRGVRIGPVATNIAEICEKYRDTHRIGTLLCVVTAWTVHTLWHVVNYAAAMGIRKVHFSPVIGNRMEQLGFGYANIFGQGCSTDMIRRTREALAEAQAAADKQGVTIVNPERIETALRNHEKRLLARGVQHS